VEIRLLCIGDVVGRPGRHVMSHAVATLVDRHHIDCVIANVENAAGGSGLTSSLYEKFLRYGVSVMTLGDHCFKRADIFPILDRSDRVIRPANLSAHAAGRPMTIFQTTRGPKVAVINLMGRLFIQPPTDCPFAAVDRLLSELPGDVNVVAVDMHAEATGEKMAMGWHLDGRVSVLFGTHTHVPTADECILPQGTAYISDLGMTGPYDSVLGRRKDRVLSALISGMPTPFDVASEDTRLCGALITVDASTGRATHIERIRVDDETRPSPGDDD